MSDLADMRERLAEAVMQHHGAYVSKWADGPGYNWECPCGAMAGEPYPRKVTPRLERDEASRQMHQHIADAALPIITEARAAGAAEALRLAELEVRDAASIPVAARAAVCAALRARANRAALGGDQ